MVSKMPGEFKTVKNSVFHFELRQNSQLTSWPRAKEQGEESGAGLFKRMRYGSPLSSPRPMGFREKPRLLGRRRYGWKNLIMMEKNGNLNWPRSPAARLSTRRRYGGLEQGYTRAGLFGKIWQGWQKMEMVAKNGGDGKIWKFRGWRSPTTGRIGKYYQYPQAQTKKGEFFTLPMRRHMFS